MTAHRKRTKPSVKMRVSMESHQDLYVRSMGKVFRVTAVFTDDGEANEHMSKTEDAVMAVFGPFIFVANKHDRGIKVEKVSP